MPNIYSRQSGATLLIALVMLVILTLFAVSAINSTSLNLKIVGNMQTGKVMEGAAQEAVEQVLSASQNFAVPVPNSQSIAVNGGSRAANGATVTVCAPQSPSSPCPSTTTPIAKCVLNTLAPGFDLTDPLAPEDDVWEVQASVTDSATGASSVVHQGFKIREPANNCP